MIVFLDTGVFGKIVHPKDTGEIGECKQWFWQLLARGAYVLTSNICYYEVRKGLAFASEELSEVVGIELLDKFVENKDIDFLEVTKDVLDRAASIRAKSLKLRIPMTDPKKLDCDSIVCAHWEILKEVHLGRYVVVATTNKRDIERFAEAEEWRNIWL